MGGHQLSSSSEDVHERARRRCDSGGDECAICLEAMSEQSTSANSTSSFGNDATTSSTKARSSTLPFPCGHSFHAECAKQWLQRNARCPVCRQSLFFPSASKTKFESTSTIEE